MSKIIKIKKPDGTICDAVIDTRPIGDRHVNKYTNIKSLGKGILAFDTDRCIWLITMNDIDYKPTCMWLRTCQFSGQVQYHLTDKTRQGVLDKFAKTL